MPEKLDWGQMSWAWITTKYSKMLSYHLYPTFHEYQENLRTHPFIVETLETKQFELFVDVGAYIGLFTIVGAFNCKRVIAYEVSPFVYGILLYNTQFNENVDCRYKWIGNENSVPKTNGGLYMMTSNGIKYNIQVVDLDSEIMPILSQYKTILIKMDIEGNEFEALKGASQLISNLNVFWIIETHPILEKNLDEKIILEYFKERDIYRVGDNFIYIRGKKV